MNTLAHIMSRFDRPKNITVDYMGSEGEGNASHKPVSEYTVWTTLSDLTHGDMMVRGYNDINYKTWSLSQFKNTTVPVFEKIVSVQREPSGHYLKHPTKWCPPNK